MTGFGKANCEIDGKKFLIEIRSLNSKQLDLTVKLPFLLKNKEVEIRNELSTRLERGKIELYIRIDAVEQENFTEINKEAIKNYYKQLSELSSEMSLTLTPDAFFQMIMRIPDVLKSENSEIDEKQWAQIFNAVISAIDSTNEHRKNEGQILYQDINARVQLINSLVDEVEKFDSKRIENVRTRIKLRLEEIANDFSYDNNRFEQEMIYYIEKNDITEEKVRLRNHCSYFLETAALDSGNGKKLGFITQEIGREINTIGSKANDYDVQKIVVQMKDELEKIKEQLMNIL